MNKEIVIANVEITTDSMGRFNLNALHRAHLAANPIMHRNSKQPADWLKLESTKELIEEVSNSEDLRIKPIQAQKGRYGGTFAHELLAISYAGWISPAFQLKVNQAFLDHKTGKLQPQQKFNIPQTMHEALRLAADLEEQRAQLEHKVEEDKPKVQFYEDVGNAKGLTNMSVAAQELDWGRNKLFGQLRLMGIFQKGKTIPYTRFIDAGYFVVKEKVTKNGEWYHQTFVTGKGMQYLHKRLNEELTHTTNNVYNIHAGVR